MRNRLGYGLVGLVCGVALGLSACGDDDDDKDETDAGLDGGADAGRDGGADAGRSMDGGMDAGGRDAGGGDAGMVSDYQCVPPPGPNGTIAKGATCCGGLGSCQDAVDGGTASFGDCNAQQNLRCVPMTGGSFDAGVPASCRMNVGGDAGTDYEGRCIPECLTRGVSSLEQGACNSGFMCVPCYSPVTGVDTGACHSGGDRPREPATSGFPACGDALGYCIATSLAGSATLPQLSCPAGEVCAPKQRVTEPDSCFAHCSSIAGAGACVPTFLVPMDSRSLLQQGTCLMGELCSPCFNPLTQMRTGACD